MSDEPWKFFGNTESSTVQQLKFRNGLVISPHILPGMWLLIHAGIKVKPC